MNALAIDNMKATIRAEYEARIKKLRDEMEDVLASLSAAEVTLGWASTPPIRSSRKLPASYAIEGNFQIGAGGRTLSAKSRILAQKSIITGRFQRMALYASVLLDGYGEMPQGTFSPSFSILVRNGEIIEVEEGLGSTPSIYMWKDEVALEELPTSTETRLF